MLISKIIRRLITHVEVNGDEEVFIAGPDESSYNYDDFTISKIEDETPILIGVPAIEKEYKKLLISEIVRRLVCYIDKNGDENISIFGLDISGDAKAFDSFKIKGFSTERNILIGVSADEEG